MSDRSINSEFLTVRAEGNKRYGKADFEGWVRSLLDSLHFSRVLDLCCGTGNQLVLYAQRPNIEQLTGVDIAERSLIQARARLDGMGVGTLAKLECVAIDEAFSRPSISEAQYDLAACFYGLYYADDPVAVLNAMIDRLAPGGALLVVGPHGANNRALFDLLSRHYKLPQAVLSSAQDFMSEIVLPTVERRLEVEKHTFVNPVRYPDPEALLGYWRASTFYEPACEQSVAHDIDVHFSAHGSFVLEKHVMAALGRNVRML